MALVPTKKRGWVNGSGHGMMGNNSLGTPPQSAFDEGVVEGEREGGREEGWEGGREECI